jgi:hypothetical protein
MMTWPVRWSKLYSRRRSQNAQPVLADHSHLCKEEKSRAASFGACQRKEKELAREDARDSNLRLCGKIREKNAERLCN